MARARRMSPRTDRLENELSPAEDNALSSDGSPRYTYPTAPGVSPVKIHIKINTSPVLNLESFMFL